MGGWAEALCALCLICALVEQITGRRRCFAAVRLMIGLRLAQLVAAGVKEILAFVNAGGGGLI